MQFRFNSSSRLFLSSFAALILAGASHAQFSPVSALNASLAPAAVPSLPGAPLRGGEPAPASPPSSPPGDSTVRVYRNYRFQYYAGFTFITADNLPNSIRPRDGFENSLTGYVVPKLGLEGALFTTFGWQYGERSRLVFGAGGPRYRWLTRNGFQGWGHALIGGTHYTPQTANGPQLAAAYEAGAGIDLLRPHAHIGFRLSGDIVATHFFSSWEYNPKLSAGVVIAFFQTGR